MFKNHYPSKGLRPWLLTIAALRLWDRVDSAVFGNRSWLHGVAIAHYEPAESTCQGRGTVTDQPRPAAARPVLD
jgi:hypothetical protein